MNGHRVAVVLVNYNGWRDTVNCLGSLSRYLQPECAIVVVDNASTDESVEQISLLFPQVVLLRSSNNRGFGGGNNMGVEYALDQKYEYIWFLNNDTLITDTTLSNMMKQFGRSEQVGAVGSVLHYMDRPSKIQAWGGGQVNFLLGRSKHLKAPVTEHELHYIVGASMLVKSSVIRKIGAFDCNFFMYWEDVDLCVRIRAAGWRLAVAHESIVYHKETASLFGKKALLDEYYNESAVRFFYKHSKFYFLPLGIGFIMRIGKRVVGLRFGHCLAIVRGYARAVAVLQSGHSRSRDS